MGVRPIAVVILKLNDYLIIAIVIDNCELFFILKQKNGKLFGQSLWNATSTESRCSDYKREYFIIRQAHLSLSKESRIFNLNFPISESRMREMAPDERHRFEDIQ